MTWSMQQISEEMARRRTSASPLFDRMMDIRDRYNADVVVPVPETDEVEDDIPLSSLAPMVIADAIDHQALYAAQVPPSILVPALSPTKTTGVRSTDYASRRRKALYWVWDECWWEMVLGRVFRHLAGYATSAIEVMLDFHNQRPSMVVRDPLTTYPEPKAPEDLSMPRNCGFITAVSLDWLHATYPITVDRFPRGSGFAVSSSTEGEVWDVVRWVDDDEIVIGVLGPRDTYQSWSTEPLRWSLELDRYPNLFGQCTAIVPKRVTLDRIISQLANLTGHADMMAKLMYLDVRATEKSVFPDRYVIGKQGSNPRLVHGEWLDGETGEVNLVVDADAIGELRGTPDQHNQLMIDRLERNLNLSAGKIPAQGGEMYSQARTGRAIDSLAGAALDPRTTELHRLAERYFTRANELILLGFAKRWPSKTFSVYSPMDPVVAEFTPGQHVEKAADGRLHVANRVFYPIPGIDDINATQVVGQMIGAHLVSEEDARALHPHVRDPIGVGRRIMVEELQKIAMQALATRAASGGVPPGDMARLVELVIEGRALHEAIAILDQEASERQAAEPPAPGPGQLMAPEAAPGLAMPGEGAEMGSDMTSIAGPGPGLQNIKALASALQSPAA